MVLKLGIINFSETNHSMVVYFFPTSCTNSGMNEPKLELSSIDYVIFFWPGNTTQNGTRKLRVGEREW